MNERPPLVASERIAAVPRRRRRSSTPRVTVADPRLPDRGRAPGADWHARARSGVRDQRPKGRDAAGGSIHASPAGASRRRPTGQFQLRKPSAHQGLESLSSMTRTDARRLKHRARVLSSLETLHRAPTLARVDALGLDADDAVAAPQHSSAGLLQRKRLTAPQSRPVPGGKRRPARLSHPGQQVHRRGMRQAQSFPAIPVNGGPPGTY